MRRGDLSLQTDPIGYGDGLNWYAYVGNDPMNKRDPMGLSGPPGSSCRVGDPGCDGHAVFPDVEVGGDSHDGWRPMGRNEYEGRDRDRTEGGLRINACSVLRSSAFRKTRRAIDKAVAHAPLDGFYMAQIQGQVVGGVGGGANVGYAVEVRKGRVASSFSYYSTSFATGFNADVGAGVYYSNISPLGDAITVNADFAFVTLALVFADGQVGVLGGGR